MKSQRSKSSTPLSVARPKQLCVKAFAMLSACILLTASSCSTMHSAAGPSALLIASCPELTPLTDGSFGATTLKLVEVSGTYHECRAAALAGSPKSTYNETQIAADR